MTTPPGAADDASLVRAAIKGANSAFSTLMTRHKDSLYRFVRRYVGDADEAFDLVQETFVACWTALHTFDVSRPFPTWLRRIALNKCRDWSRRRRVRQFFFGAKPLNAADVAASDEGESDTTSEVDLAVLEAAIAALPSALKEPLLLTTFEQLSHQEAADVLGVSPKAIETRVYRAKQKLREALQRAGDQRTN